MTVPASSPGGQPDLVGRADARRDDELVGGEHQLATVARLAAPERPARAAAPPLVLEPDRLRGVDLAQPRPLLGRGGEDHLCAGREVELESTEAPQAAQPVVAAGALGPVGDVDQPVVVAPAGRRGRLRQQPQRRQPVVARSPRRSWPPSSLRSTRNGSGVRSTRPSWAAQRQRRCSARGGRDDRRRPAGRRRARCSAGG